jgi:CRISPR-associated protein Cas2
MMLLDLGFIRVQLSVYGKFSTSAHAIIPSVSTIKRNLPEGGEVRILSVTDHQWASAERFSNAEQEAPEDAPMQLTIF